MRAEICGAILALAAGRPTRMAIDNSGVVRGINQAERARQKDRPFIFHRKANEDLWEVVWNIFQRRLPGVTVAKWTKGHATEQDIKQGITTKWEADQNHLADQAADEGRLMHGEETRLYAPHYRNAITEYQHFIARIRAHMLLTIKRMVEINNENNPVKYYHAGHTDMIQYVTWDSHYQGQGQSERSERVQPHRPPSKLLQTVQPSACTIFFKPWRSPKAKAGANKARLGSKWDCFMRTGLQMPRRWPPGALHTESS